MMEYGTNEWWRKAPALGVQGVIDTILRLFEQDEITRNKAKELIGDYYRGVPTIPRAPWDKLNWGDVETERRNIYFLCPSCRGKITAAESATKVKCPRCGAEFDAEVKLFSA